MKGTIEARAKDLALYMIEHRSTVRSAAKAFGVSKSTVHKDLQERLPAINPSLYRQVKEILEENKADRHIRGGIATRIIFSRRSPQQGHSCLAGGPLSLLFLLIGRIIKVSALFSGQAEQFLSVLLRMCRSAQAILVKSTPNPICRQGLAGVLLVRRQEFYF